MPPTPSPPGKEPRHIDPAATARGELVLRGRKLCKSYGSGEAAVHALRDVDLDVTAGEFVVLLGASGNGKSTLLNILGGLDSPTSGELLFQGRPLTGASDEALTTYRREHVGFVFQFYEERRLPAEVIGVDRRTDVAVLKIAATNLPVAAIGSSARLCAGEWVAALGSPFGLEQSVTPGMVSPYPRFLPGGSGVPLIQTDVALNPGNSGGPLFNERGEVVGVNSMAYSASGGYLGVSFTLPIENAMRIAAELRSTGRVTRGQIGTRTQALTPDLASAFGLDAALGALIVRVDAGGPAAAAGLRSAMSC